MSTSTYGTRNTYPEVLPNATIHLSGLLCLCFDGSTKCTVGVNQVDGEHKWRFWVKEQGASEYVVDLKPDSNVREIYINITGGFMGGSYVFTGEFDAPTDTSKHRFNLENSWIDLEGARGHNQPIANDPNTLWPRFYINDGLFCASRLSTESFALKDSKAPPLEKPLGPVALEMVADIFLHPSASSPKIEIKLSAEKTVPLDSSKRYEIVITNDCDSASESVGDFHLHYNSFSGVFDELLGTMKAAEKFELIPDSRTRSRKSESILAQAGDYSDSLESVSNRAPCMGIALGQTTEFIK